jgi:FkbM family methyltransferase
VDLARLGPRFARAAFARRTAGGDLRVRVRGYGGLWIRRGDSDVTILRQVFSQRPYDLARHAHAAAVQAHYTELVDRGQRPVVIDAGANIGASSVWFATHFPDAEVVAVEPDAESVALCRRNTDRFRNVRVEHCALGGSEGTARLGNHAAGSWAVSTSRTHEPGGVPIRTIADLRGEDEGRPLFLVKVDIEGFERDLFDGSIDWLDEVAVVIVEPHDWLLPGKGSSRSMQQAFGERDFDMLIADENLVYIRGDLSRGPRATSEQVSLGEAQPVDLGSEP